MNNGLMKFDPATGKKNPYPSHGEQWRVYNGCTAWLFNPFSGKKRDARDIGSDCFGYGIEEPRTDENC